LVAKVNLRNPVSEPRDKKPGFYVTLDYVTELIFGLISSPLFRVRLTMITHPRDKKPGFSKKYLPPHLPLHRNPVSHRFRCWG